MGFILKFQQLSSQRSTPNSTYGRLQHQSSLGDASITLAYHQKPIPATHTPAFASGMHKARLPTRGENSFLEAKIVFYIRTIWESGKKYFLVLHDNNFSISSCLFFFCEFHNSKPLLLKYLWETEKNGLFFWQPTPSGCYFQLPGGCGR